MDMVQKYHWLLTLLVCAPALLVVGHSVVRFIFRDWLGFFQSKEAY